MKKKSTAYKTIILEKKDHVAKLTFNRPQVLNALNEEMFAEVNAGLDDVMADDDIRVFVLTGAGRGFSTSADFRELKKGSDRLLGYMSDIEAWEFIRKYPQQITMKLHKMRKPTIAMVNGFAVADGADWAFACDIRIASQNARFMNAFVHMGLVSCAGATWLYPRALGVTKALQLLYTGDWLTAKQALQLGVVAEVVPHAKLEKVTMELAKRIAQRPPIANRIVKELVYRGLHESLDEHMLAAGYSEAFTLTTKDHKEGLAAFLAHRPPKFTGR